jgi:membrane-bound lytic murein transglycosylase A
MRALRLLWLLAPLASGCVSGSGTFPIEHTTPSEATEPPARAVEPASESVSPPESAALPAPPPPRPSMAEHFAASSWESLPGWQTDTLQEAWPALIASCMALKSKPEWQPVCWAASELRSHDPATVRTFFESQFRPWTVRNADGSEDGLVTGYYEPLLHGSRTRTEKYRYPLYGVPDDLIAVEIGDLFPELKGQRVRGRVEGRRLVPYYTRGEIDSGRAGFDGRELFWLDDPVELFFLHVQGSGRLQLDSGETVRVGYAEHNGHPYRSIGKRLIERGELAPQKASMQGIQGWAKENPEKLPALLAENPAYVFFRERPDTASGPIGTLGVALTARRSIAVDNRAVPLGAPVYLATTWPASSEPLNRLMLAQDTGSAIKGAVRADFFWGFGQEAGQLAGKMRQGGRMWVLLPKDLDPGGLQ